MSWRPYAYSRIWSAMLARWLDANQRPDRSGLTSRDTDKLEVDHGDIEAAAGTAKQRVQDQEPWLSRLPVDFETVLDVGAGAGYHSKWFLDHGKKPVALDRYGLAFKFAS